MELTEADYKFLTIEQATNPTAGGFFVHYVNSWWAVHPGKGLAFYNPGRHRRRGLGAPQCNANEQIARSVADKTVPWDADIHHFASVWIPISIDDYR